MPFFYTPGSTRSIHDLAEHRSRFSSGPPFILGGERSHEILYLVPPDEVDGRPAEAAAGEPRAQAARMGFGKLHQQIQFRGAVFEKVARALVALKKILAELLEIAFPQRA